MLGELRKKSESQMRFEPTTFRDLFRCSKHRTTAETLW